MSNKPGDELDSFNKLSLKINERDQKIWEHEAWIENKRKAIEEMKKSIQLHEAERKDLEANSLEMQKQIKQIEETTEVQKFYITLMGDVRKLVSYCEIMQNEWERNQMEKYSKTVSSCMETFNKHKAHLIETSQSHKILQARIIEMKKLQITLLDLKQKTYNECSMRQQFFEMQEAKRNKYVTNFIHAYNLYEKSKNAHKELKQLEVKEKECVVKFLEVQQQYRTQEQRKARESKRNIRHSVPIIDFANIDDYSTLNDKWTSNVLPKAMDRNQRTSLASQDRANMKENQDLPPLQQHISHFSNADETATKPQENKTKLNILDVVTFPAKKPTVLSYDGSQQHSTDSSRRAEFNEDHSKAYILEKPSSSTTSTSKTDNTSISDKLFKAAQRIANKGARKQLSAYSTPSCSQNSQTSNENHIQNTQNNKTDARRDILSEDSNTSQRNQKLKDLSNLEKPKLRSQRNRSNLASQKTSASHSNFASQKISATQMSQSKQGIKNKMHQQQIPQSKGNMSGLRGSNFQETQSKSSHSAGNASQEMFPTEEIHLPQSKLELEKTNNSGETKQINDNHLTNKKVISNSQKSQLDATKNKIKSFLEIKSSEENIPNVQGENRGKKENIITSLVKKTVSFGTVSYEPTTQTQDYTSAATSLQTSGTSNSGPVSTYTTPGASNSVSTFNYMTPGTVNSSSTSTFVTPGTMNTGLASTFNNLGTGNTGFSSTFATPGMPASGFSNMPLNLGNATSFNPAGGNMNVTAQDQNFSFDGTFDVVSPPGSDNVSFPPSTFDGFGFGQPSNQDNNKAPFNFNQASYFNMF